MLQKQTSWKKTATYYLTMVTLIVFIMSELITRGPLQTIANAIDEMKIKYAFMAFSAFFLLAIIICKRKKLFKNNIFLTEAKLFFGAIAGLGLITFYYQIKNGFRAFVIPEFCYILLPLLFVVLIVSVDSYNITRVLDNCFYFVVIAFLLCNLDILTPSSLKEISFSESASPFEQGSSIIFVCFELYYLIRYGRKNGKTVICLILTILTFKRVSVIKAILFFIFVPMIKDKKVPKWLIISIIVIFCALPFLLEFIYSNDFASIVAAKYGMEINELTMDRFARTVFVLEHVDSIKFGYGSVTYFLTNSYGMHIDAT